MDNSDRNFVIGTIISGGIGWIIGFYINSSIFGLAGNALPISLIAGNAVATIAILIHFVIRMELDRII